MRRRTGVLIGLIGAVIAGAILYGVVEAPPAQPMGKVGATVERLVP